MTVLPSQDNQWVNIVAGLHFKPISSGFHANLAFRRDLGRKMRFQTRHPSGHWFYLLKKPAHFSAVRISLGIYLSECRVFFVVRTM